MQDIVDMHKIILDFQDRVVNKGGGGLKLAPVLPSIFNKIYIKSLLILSRFFFVKDFFLYVKN